jgi:hypothetical protein
MFRALSALTVFAAVGIAGFIPGAWEGRWTPSASFDRAGERLSAVPMKVGDWTGRDLDVNPRVREVAGAAGLLSRRYLNATTGGSLQLLIVSGRPGPVSVHTPDVCYVGSGNEEVGAAYRFDVPGASGDQLWVRRFQKVSAAPTSVRVLYGWTADGKWQAPEYPRLTFARSGILYKMYVHRELARADEPLEGDPAVDFLRDLVSPLRAALFPAS